MKMKKINNIIRFILVLAILGVGCKKDFLDIKPDKKLVVPETVEDAQALLDNDIMYTYSPYIGEVSSGDFNVEYNRWLAFPLIDRNAYIWAKDVYEGSALNDWNYMYRKVYYSNIAIEVLGEINPAPNERAAYDNAFGSALFFRAWNFYVLAQVFGKPFNEKTAGTDLGIPLRLHSDLNITSTRSSVAETYNRIISDVKAAVKILPGVGILKTRPSRAACYGLLARTYLLMSDFRQAALYADSAIKISPEIIDFNTLNASLAFPLTQFNKEVVFHQSMPNIAIFNSARLIMDADLYNAYTVNDLRKTVFFFQNAGNTTYKGSYNGSAALFGGLAGDELYLIRAEGNARTGKLLDAEADLNFLLLNRYKKGTFTSYSGLDQAQLLKLILAERRKELIFRGIRWSDLRRLNMEPSTAVTLVRTLNNQVFKLEPNSPRYTFAFPDDVISLSGMVQNER